ncbi:MAG: glycogen synthase GlgA [Candidatus Eisenbacteria bacterium]
MHLVYVSSEVEPFAKTGGLADVAAALPRSLARRGHRISVVLPFYGVTKKKGLKTKPTDWTIRVPMGEGEETARIFEARMEKKGRYLLVEHAGYYEAGDGLYGTPEGDYPNNSSRFAFFCKVAADLIGQIGEPVDIVHCNDWQTGLLPAYLEIGRGRSVVPGGTRTVLSNHNLAYRGACPAEEYAVTGLPAELYRPHGGVEFYGKVSFLKAGLLFADAVTTVSPRYAEEIRTAELGEGMEGLLASRGGRLFGILNGIDADVWNPETDPLIPSRYSMKNLAGKKRCKTALQKECGLEIDPSVPLVGMVTRLADQKGIDLVVEVLPRLRRAKHQLVILGTGDERYHEIFRALQKKKSRSVSVHIKFDDALAHRIEAGADIFLMPSRYEPCGLNQMYSLRYGTVPVVRATGGLADTVVDCTGETLGSGTATGFRFEEATPDALEGALRRAFALFPDRRAWLKLVRAGMAADFSWERSAAEYEKLYARLLAEPAPASA